MNRTEMTGSPDFQYSSEHVVPFSLRPQCAREDSSVMQRKIQSASNSSGVVLVTQSFPTLCDPMNCSRPGSSVHETFRQEYWSGFPFPFFREVCISLRLITTIKSHQLEDSSRSLHFSDPVSSLKLV